MEELIDQLRKDIETAGKMTFTDPYRQAKHEQITRCLYGALSQALLIRDENRMYKGEAA
jgi:hypothetical protein